VANTTAQEPITETLPAPVVRKLHALEVEARTSDADVEAIKTDLKDARTKADAAHQALIDYVRALTDPNYCPLFKATVDPVTGEIVHTGDDATGSDEQADAAHL